METRRLYENDLTTAKKVIEKFGQYADGEPMPSVEHITGLLGNNTCYVLAALEYEDAVGFILAYRFPSLYVSYNIAYLYDIEVEKNHRNTGIGRQLINLLLEELKKDNVKEIWLGTGVSNVPAQTLFTLTGAQKNPEAFYEYFYFPE